MGLRCGIVGLPNVGKSTIFNALSNAKAEAANFPFCTIEPNVGVITVPDNRLDILADLVHPEKVLPTVIEFVDIAGLVKGASKGEGLGNKFLANIREVDAIVHVIRCFDDPNISHVAGSVDPVFDREVIDTELQFKDLESIENKIKRIEKIAKSGDATAKKQLHVVLKYKVHLESGANARTIGLPDQEVALVADLQLLTDKPVIYVANVDEKATKDGNQFVRDLKVSIESEAQAGDGPLPQLVVLCGAIESQIAELEVQEQQLFLEEYGLKVSGLSKLIKASYRLLDLITYFTAGPKEVRAWTIQRGWKAPKAAGVIHTDFEKGFIKAEVIKLEDYKYYKTELACKEAGKMAIEGKEYVVEDADIVHFRFNV